MEYNVINDEVLHNAFRRVRGQIHNPLINDSLYRVRDDISDKLSGCANNVTVKVHMEGIPTGPIVVSSGNGDNTLSISINKNGKVEYCWLRETWTKHFRNAASIVNSIAKRVVSSIGSFFRGILTSINELEGNPSGYLAYN